MVVRLVETHTTERRDLGLLDLGAQHGALEHELGAAFTRVLAGGSLIGGPEVASFEHAWATLTGVAHAVGTSSGTSALAMALRACGVTPGSEVVTTPLTFVATAAAIVAVGAVPVLADVDEDTGLLSIAAAERAIGPRTSALLPVHLWGQPVDLAAWRVLADVHGLALIEDACQAHGASHSGLAAGAVGDAAAFSFYPGKNLGALGDGGAVTTPRAEIAERIRLFRDHGRSGHTSHVEVGGTERLDALQAAFLQVKLPHLMAWNARRAEIAARYDAAFAGLAGARPIVVAPAATSAHHHYVLVADERERLAAELAADGVGSGVHYPTPVHRQPGFTGRVRIAGSLAVSERLAASVLSIPVHQDLADDDVDRVIGAVRSALPARARTLRIAA
jgi:dTDP-4-amino-4,6-dideoxygalactose transaminase